MFGFTDFNLNLNSFRPSVWLKASHSTTSGGVVTMVDLSGNGRNGTSVGSPAIVQNVLNGHPVIRFSGGITDKITGNITINGTTLTVVIVAKWITGGNSFGRMVSFNDGTNPDFNTPNSCVPLLNFNHGANQISSHRNSTNLQNPTINADQFNLLTSMWNGSINSIFVDATRTDSGASTGTFAIVNFELFGDQFSENLLGDLAEVLIFDRALDVNAELKYIWSSLKGKYGLA